jgi:hypothetical protein
MEKLAVIFKILKKYWFVVFIVIALIITVTNEALKQNKPPEQQVYERLMNQDKHLERFAGSYLRFVENAPVTSDNEMYVLAANGSAKWMWLEVKGSSTNVKQEKPGTWFPVENTIHITINGFTGPIEHTFTFDGDKFRNGDIYLVKVNK